LSVGSNVAETLPKPFSKIRDKLDCKIWVLL
jgi:hypothetical protein